METKEINYKGFKANGFVMLFVILALLALIVWSFFPRPLGRCIGSYWFCYLVSFIAGLDEAGAQ